MDDYLSKPFKPQELLEIVGRHLPHIAESAAGSDTREEGKPSLSREAVVEHVEGDLSLLSELISFMRENYPGMLEKVERAITSRDADELQAHAHALRMSSG